MVMRAMNRWQQAIANTYDGGEHAHLIEMPDWQEYLKTCGDGLFQFIITELGDGEDCGSLETATLRLGTALHQVAECLAALSHLADESHTHG